MTLYKLYLKSGPRRKKTMVHVLDLLGCVSSGPTTEAALDQTPQAIYAYRRFLYRHGKTIDLDEEIQTEIAEHITEYAYMRAFGKLEGLPGLGSIVKKREGSLLEWMAHVRGREIERLRAMTVQERSEPFIHWKYTRTARKVMRRMLEHQWEHLVEIQLRLRTS